MRSLLIALLLITFPGLLFALFWVPGSGPREIFDISVAEDGSFTTYSESYGGFRGRIDYWDPGLNHQKRINLSGFLSEGDHALSPDGSKVAAITTDGRSQTIELVGVAEGTLKVAIDAPEGWVSSLDFCGKNESVLARFDSENNVFIFGQDGNVNQRLHSGYELYSAFGSQYFAMSNRVRLASPASDFFEYRFYNARTTPLQLIYREQRPTEDWAGQGVAIGANGMIVVQHPDHIQFRDTDGSERKIDWPAERGKVLQIDPTNSYLLLSYISSEQQSVIILDAQAGKVLGRREFTWGDWSIFGLNNVRFRDASSLLFTESFNGPSGSVSGRIVRWKWREDTTTTKSVGGTTDKIFFRRLKWLDVSLLVWCVIATGLARSSHRKITPTIVLAAVSGLGCVWAFYQPRFEELYLEWETANPSWLVLTTIWLVIPVRGCLAICHAPDKILRWLPILVLLLALSADRLHHLFPTGSWFFPLILLLVSIWLIGVSIFIEYFMARRQKAAQIDRSVWVGSQIGSFRLIDLVLLIGALAVVFGLLSKFDGFDQNLTSIIWALVCSILLAFVAALVGWLSLSKASWWKRYLPLVGLAFLVPWGFTSIVSFFDFRSIDGGDQFPIFNLQLLPYMIWLFTAFLVYAMWLYRGTMIDSQSNGVIKPNYQILLLQLIKARLTKVSLRLLRSSLSKKIPFIVAVSSLLLGIILIVFAPGFSQQNPYKTWWYGVGFLLLVITPWMSRICRYGIHKTIENLMISE